MRSAIFWEPLLVLAVTAVSMLGMPGMGRAEGMKGPPVKGTSLAVAEVEDARGISQLLLGPIRFFQEYISPTDGARCQFSPTCSTFGHDAISVHGPWLGLLMTADRLMRCSYLTDPSVYPQLPNGWLDDPVPSGGGEE